MSKPCKDGDYPLPRGPLREDRHRDSYQMITGSELDENELEEDSESEPLWPLRWLSE